MRWAIKKLAVGCTTATLVLGGAASASADTEIGLGNQGTITPINVPINVPIAVCGNNLAVPVPVTVQNDQARECDNSSSPIVD
ncbi:hypothetical protein [Streptomyces sp. XH2]|uniref:hypothetical protein n=1 Tax=Streptomyces sp. XH2 TaxID=3412483 RepID=UPI003C7E8510